MSMPGRKQCLVGWHPWQYKGALKVMQRSPGSRGVYLALLKCCCELGKSMPCTAMVVSTWHAWLPFQDRFGRVLWISSGKMAWPLCYCIVGMVCMR